MSLPGELGRFFMDEIFEAIAQALRLIVRIPLSSGGESTILAKKKRLPIVVFPHLCM